MLGGPHTVLEVKVRFLHLREREANETNWQEAVEREVNAPSLRLSQLIAQPHRALVFFPSAQENEDVRDANGKVNGVIVRRQEAIGGAVELRAADCGLGIAPGRLFRIMVRILNQTTFENAAAKTRDEALLGSFVSAHTILAVNGGEFISLLDPPEEFREAAAGCRNIGAWPVLVGPAPVGEEGEHDLMLSSPIILYDYPQIAPESAGDLFDGTEIDEILLLRIMTLTEEEKREMRQGDERARQILERTETLTVEQLTKLHGALRGLHSLEEQEL